MKRALLSAGLLGLAVAGWVFAQAAGGNEAPKAGKAEIGQPAPTISLSDGYGKTYSLSDFRGKIVVLEWINHKCPVSKAKHDDQTMQKTYAKYAGKGVVWLGVDSTAGRSAEEIRVAAVEHMLNYPVLHDPEGKAGHAFGARTTPHMFVIDKEGKLVYNGAIDDKEKTNYVAAALDDLLEGKPVKTSRTEPYGCSVKYARQ